MKDVTIISSEEKEILVKNASLAMATANMIMSKTDKIDGNNIIVDRKEWNSLVWAVKALTEVILEPEDNHYNLSSMVVFGGEDMFKIKDTEERCFYCSGYNRSDKRVRALRIQNDDGELKEICHCNNCLREFVRELYKDGNFMLEIN